MNVQVITAKEAGDVQQCTRSSEAFVLLSVCGGCPSACQRQLRQQVAVSQIYFSFCVALTPLPPAILSSLGSFWFAQVRFVTENTYCRGAGQRAKSHHVTLPTAVMGNGSLQC